MKKKLNITVMLGGPSAEREVSLASGAAVAGALRSLGHAVEELDPVKRDWQLSRGTDVVFLALHGAYGEDGTVQAQLEAMGVPYTGSGVESSRLAFDKALAKDCFVKAGVPTPRFMVLRERVLTWPMGWKPPLVLKPACQGSSLGLQFVERVSDWSESVEEVFRKGGAVLMEQRILGREVTAGILGDAMLPLVEVRPRQGVYDYRSKYTPGATEYFCPAPFDAALTARIQEVALQAYQSVGCRHYGRVDVMITPAGDPYVLEVNTLPGMTETSLLPKAAAAMGIPYPELCERMVRLAFDHGSEGTRIDNAA